MLTVVLLAVRIATMLLMTPLLAPLQITSIRVLLVFAFAIVLTAAFPQQRIADMPNLAAFFSAVLIEFALGLALGLVIQIAFAVFSIAGRLLDVQIGFGLAQIFDPLTQQQAPILSSFFNQLALLLFFVSNMHHVLLRGLAYSVERFPPGRGWSLSASAPVVMHYAAGLFNFSFGLVAPIIFCILLLECALAVLTRSLPQMNIFAIGIPAKILVGLAALAVWLLTSTNGATRIYSSIFQTWNGMLK